MSSLQPPDHDGETLDLTIRFSASIPDLLLSLPNTTSVSTSTLKQQIRIHLPPDFSRRRIRLIYSGKALPDGTSLGVALKRPQSHTPSRSSTPIPSSLDINTSKGKTAIRDPPSTSRIYIHCSIGDVVLSAADLAAESAAASPAPVPTPHPSHSPDDASLHNAPSLTFNPTIANSTTTTPAPRGFDRLLTAGFTPAEVANLRLQFLAIQAHTHTPDAMPSPTTLRNMEDQWLDNSNAGSSTTMGSGGGGGGGGMMTDDDGAAGQLDDIIWGGTMGFFWPVACMLWAFREPGIWTRRRKMAVTVGLVSNVAIGIMRWMR